MKYVLLIFTFILVSGFIIFCYVVNETNNNYKEQNSNRVNSFFCGTSAMENNNRSVEGKRIFNSNCATCHKLNKKTIGPALDGISKKYDSITLIKYIKGEKTLIEKKGFQNKCMDFSNLSENEILDLLNYTN
jgi:cytochrome c551/c552